MLKNLSELVFKPVRKTKTGSVIIDIEETSYQTPWLKVLYDVEYSLCLSTEGIENILTLIDNIVIDECVKSLDFTKEEIIEMYKNLSKRYWGLSIGTGTVFFDKAGDHYYKSDFRKMIKQGNYVRCIIKFKKVYYSDHTITLQIELLQIEK